MTGKDHNKLLSIFFFVLGGIQFFSAAVIVLIYGGIGIAALANSRRQDDQVMGGVFLGLAVVVGLIVFALAGIMLFAGWKMIKGKSAARTFGIIASFISFITFFPFGVALGIYGVWFFFSEQGKQFYSGDYQHLNFQPPPPPNNWQR